MGSFKLYINIDLNIDAKGYVKDDPMVDTYRYSQWDNSSTKPLHGWVKDYLTSIKGISLLHSFDPAIGVDV